MKELSNVSRDENFKYQTCSTHEEKECLLDQLKTVYGQQSELENKHPDRNLKLEKQTEMNRKKKSYGKTTNKCKVEIHKGREKETEIAWNND